MPGGKGAGMVGGGGAARLEDEWAVLDGGGGLGGGPRGGGGEGGVSGRSGPSMLMKRTHLYHFKRDNRPGLSPGN